jgi:hypothetical protein
MREEGATYREIGDSLGVSGERARQLLLRARCGPERPEWALGLRAQTWECIRREVLWNRADVDLATVNGLARFSEAQLLDIANFGQKALAEVQAVLAEHGVRLRGQ